MGADLETSEGRWRIKRIYSTETWNPNLSAPLTAPGLRVAVGQYMLAINGVRSTANNDPYSLLDGTANRQTVLTMSATPTMQGACNVTVVPIRERGALRQRAWVEDNRRRVDSAFRWQARVRVGAEHRRPWRHRLQPVSSRSRTSRAR